MATEYHALLTTNKTTIQDALRDHLIQQGYMASYANDISSKLMQSISYPSPGQAYMIEQLQELGKTLTTFMQSIPDHDVAAFESNQELEQS